ncbi:alpha-glucosidase family protein (plasmid) [Skermanella mucosa]|uniref:alpha-glucosidase family protein n=1 Tax=Skermanella mucosa TaxID=1789672 RepID=UPI00192C2793|nr:alpha-glucosidase family protein [Skermanella mucosa]UEM25126.1 alpha-glucosidase family protein [Skermanella mucosa]
MTSRTPSPAPSRIAGNDPDWWRGAVIYEIYPRSFQDSDGDGIGDLRGITARLPYVADLGVDAVWLAPFFTSPQKDFGYDISDYCNIDPAYGTLADFDALIAEAHRLGLKVMIDQVLSHSSDRHPWFVESRSSRDSAKADWYVWADPRPDGGPPNNWLSVFGGSSWQWDSRRRQYYLHNFLTEQPDLNFHNEEVVEALLNTVKFWLDRGVDGFRLDTTNFYFHDAELRSNPPDPDVPDHKRIEAYHWQDHRYDKNRPEVPGFLRRLRALLDLYPGSATVGEIGQGPRSLELMALYTGGGDKLHMAYTFDFLGAAFSAGHFRSHVARFEEVAADGWPCWAFSNHDVVRHLSRWRGHAKDDRKLASLAAAILLSLRGSVCLYQGEELGLHEAELAYEDLVDPYGLRLWPEFKGRDGCRTPMVWDGASPAGGFTGGKPWLPVSAAHLARAVDRQRAVDTSVLSEYRRLLRFRRDNPALVKGSITFVENAAPEPGETLAFVRRHGDSAILCLFNLSAEPAEFRAGADLPGVIGTGRDRIPLEGHEALFLHIGPGGQALPPAGTGAGLTASSSTKDRTEPRSTSGQSSLT